MAESVTESIVPFLKSYCLDCHNTEQAEAKLDLSGFKTASDIAAGHQTWNEVIHRLEAGFDNSAESLTLSPALMNKYLARLVKLSSIWC